MSRGKRPPGPRALKIGANVREVRDAMGLSRPALAERCGLSDGIVTNIELGRSVLTADQLLALADGLGVRVDRLLKDLPARDDGRADR